MAFQVVNGAELACTFGTTPSHLAVLPVNRTEVADRPAANIQDHVPLLNIQPFGLCMSPSNPQVAAATAAALGVLTPQPCIPVTPAPWAPGAANTVIAQFPALDNASTCSCAWSGVISVIDPGQQTVEIP